MLIRVLDLEATAFPEDGGRICQVGFCDLIGGEGNRWTIGHVSSRLCHPGIHIPSTSSAVHHIIDDDVRDAQPFDVQEIIWDGRGHLVTIFAAHNAKAEKGFLSNHLALDVLGTAKWCCSYKAAMRHWPDAPGHSNQALRYELGLAVPREFRGHGAGEDAFVTALLLERLLDEVPLETLLDWSSKPVLQTICWIGKQRGTKWAEVDSGFMGWCLDKDFDEDVLFTCRYWLEKRENERRDEVHEDPFDGERDVAGQVLEQRGQQRLL